MLRYLTSLLTLLVLAVSVPAFCAQPLAVTFHSFTTSADFTAPGAIFEGTRLAKGGDAIIYGSSVGSINYNESYGSPPPTYSYARSTPPWFNTASSFRQFVPS